MYAHARNRFAGICPCIAIILIASSSTPWHGHLGGSALQDLPGIAFLHKNHQGKVFPCLFFQIRSIEIQFVKAGRIHFEREAESTVHRTQAPQYIMVFSADRTLGQSHKDLQAGDIGRATDNNHAPHMAVRIQINRIETDGKEGFRVGIQQSTQGIDGSRPFLGPYSPVPVHARQAVAGAVIPQETVISRLGGIRVVAHEGGMVLDDAHRVAHGFQNRVHVLVGRCAMGTVHAAENLQQGCLGKTPGRIHLDHAEAQGIRLGYSYRIQAGHPCRKTTPPAFQSGPFRNRNPQRDGLPCLQRRKEFPAERRRLPAVYGVITAATGKGLRGSVRQLQSHGIFLFQTVGFTLVTKRRIGRIGISRQHDIVHIPEIVGRDRVGIAQEESDLYRFSRQGIGQSHPDLFHLGSLQAAHGRALGVKACPRPAFFTDFDTEVPLVGRFGRKIEGFENQ